MAKFELVVFDMAGTTVLDNGNVADSFIAAFHDEGIQVERDEVKKVMGWRKKDAIRILLEKYHPQAFMNEDRLIDRIHDSFIEKMVAFYKSDPGIAPMPGAEQVFGILKQEGVKIALNTGFTKEITDTILQRLHWKNGNTNIDYVISSDEVPEGRPYPFMIETIMHEMKLTDPKLVVKIGDTEVDVQEGRNADCGLVVSVTTGAYSRGQLQKYNPDHIIDSLSELPPLIL
jgi:phosphonatase-like hydrolase